MRWHGDPRRRSQRDFDASFAPQFDPAWYTTTYPDVTTSGLDPLTHYLTIGVHEGRQPSPHFDPAWYTTTYPDVTTSGLDPYWHYLVFGIREGRSGIPPVEPIWGLGLAALRSTQVSASLQAETFESVLSDRSTARVSGSTVVFEWSVPTPDLDSGSLRISRLIQLMLEQGRRVSLCADQPAPSQRYARQLADLGVDVHIGATEIQAFLQTLGAEIDTVWLSRPMTAGAYIPAVRAYCPSATLIYDTVDVHWIRLTRQAELDSAITDRAVAVMQSRELAFCKESDHVVTVTEADRDALVDRGVDSPVAVIPNVHIPGDRREQPPANCDLVFLGSFDHAPNRDSLTYFLNEIFDRIRLEVPSARLLVVGSRLERWMEVTETDSVKPLGYVEDLGSVLRRARAMVVPLRFGAGMKGKIGSAMEEGLPVVTTTVGAEGMGLVQGEHALIADDPLTFASSVAEICQRDDMWLHLSQVGQDHLSTHYSNEAVGPKLALLLKERQRARQ